MPITSIKKIKDPIHGYVHYSKIEERFLSHPLILRLHHIRQNGAAFLTYPSMRVHRFEHSIGTMHIAGEMFNRGIHFSTDDNTVAKLKIVLEELGYKPDRIASAVKRNASVSGQSRNFVEEDGLYKLYNLNDVDSPDRLSELLFFQAVRLAALVHDIGHPPFSHTLETALKQKDHKLYRNHEIVGLELLRIILEDIHANELFRRGEYDLAQPATDIAAVILDKKHELHRYLLGLAAIVSSDIDCDRLDYVRRDAQSAGLTTNAYDLGRLYDAIKLTVEKSHRRHSIKLTWTAHALSFIEAFFSVRFHLYRWALWHHNVVRQNMALIVIASCLHDLAQWKLNYLAKINPEISEIFELALEEKFRRDYWYFTDYFFLDKLARIYRFLEQVRKDPEKTWRGKPNQHPKNDKAEWGVVADLHKFLETFLFRRKQWLTPFWKRPDDYETFGKKVLGAGPERSRELNGKLDALFNRVMQSEAKNLGVNISTLEKENDFKSEYSDYLVGRFNREIEKAVNDELSPHSCKIRAYYIARFAPFPKDLKLASDGGWHDVKTLSPSVAGLETAWNAVPHLWLFREFYAYKENGESFDPPVDVPNHLGKVEKKTAKVLKSLLSTIAVPKHGARGKTRSLVRVKS